MTKDLRVRPHLPRALAITLFVLCALCAHACASSNPNTVFPSCPTGGEVTSVSEAAEGRTVRKSETVEIKETSDYTYTVSRDGYACRFPKCAYSFVITQDRYECRCPPTYMLTSHGECICPAYTVPGPAGCRCEPPFVASPTGCAPPDCDLYGAKWDGQRCVCVSPKIGNPPSTPCSYGKCPNDRHLRDQVTGACTCPPCVSGKKVVDNLTCECGCHDDQDEINGRCTCKKSYLTAFDFGCACRGDLIDKNGSCVCPGVMVANGSFCECPIGSDRIPGTNDCVPCRADQRWNEYLQMCN